MSVVVFFHRERDTDEDEYLHEREDSDDHRHEPSHREYSFLLRRQSRLLRLGVFGVQSK